MSVSNKKGKYSNSLIKKSGLSLERQELRSAVV